MIEFGWGIRRLVLKSKIAFAVIILTHVRKTLKTRTQKINVIMTASFGNFKLKVHTAFIIIYSAKQKV